MTNKINLVINLSILALLIYLAVNVNKLNDKVFPDPKIMIPLTQSNEDRTNQLEELIKDILIQKLTEENAKN
tara:strand:+ start:1280 stop:1495 length:216 start_codon:yes stop_codon:yes gene_type:complete